MASGGIVKLDIGGTLFKTSKSTLTKFDGFFKTMLETDVPLNNDEHGEIFVDRDPKHFRYILNYMRDGFVNIPDSKADIEEIQIEAQFYLLDGLVELCAAKLFEQLPIIESDAHLLNLIALSEKTGKPVLVIYHQIDGGFHNFCMPHSTIFPFFREFLLLRDLMTTANTSCSIPILGTCVPDFNFTVFMEEYQDRFDIWFRPTNDKENDWSCFRIFSNNTGLMTSGRLDHIDFCISKQQERR